MLFKMLLIVQLNIWEVLNNEKDVKATLAYGKATASTAKQTAGEFLTAELGTKVGMVDVVAGYYDFKELSGNFVEDFFYCFKIHQPNPHFLLCSILDRLLDPDTQQKWLSNVLVAYCH